MFPFVPLSGIETTFPYLNPEKSSLHLSPAGDWNGYPSFSRGLRFYLHLVELKWKTYPFEGLACLQITHQKVFQISLYLYKVRLKI